MSDTILLLQLEHRHADRLLALIEQQIDLGQSCDLEVLDDIAAYFLDYPDLCHHPVEETVLRHLKARDPDGAAGVEQLTDDHDFIAEVARAFASLVREAHTDENVLRNRLPEEARYFVDHYRRHMHAEEREFFPLAERRLTEDDWAQIEYDLFDREDPLYDTATENRFRALREKIEAEVGPSLERGAALHRARQLRHLDGVDAFNALMAGQASEHRLVAHSSSGYSLMDGEHVLVDIPPCDEGRAAWCAWFYLQAR